MDESAVAKEILDWLRISKDFVADQAPLLVQEVLYWGVVSSALWLVVSILVVIAMSFLIRKSYLRWRNDSEMTIDAVTIPFCSITLLTFLIIGLANLSVFVKVLVAPRLYLIEQLRHLIP